MERALRIGKSLRPGAESPAELLEAAAAAEASLAARGGRFVLRGEADYPGFGALADAPDVLSVRGRFPSGPRVAIVGSRDCDVPGRDEARRLAAGLVRAGRVVISGGARGIDAAAHQGALDGGGPTIAVLAGSVLWPGPPCNRRLFARILESGALTSEMSPDELPFPKHFPRRNRLVATMSSAVVVIRASQGSGTLHTARAARKAGVPVLARRGGGAGCEAILAEGGEPFSSVAEALDRLGVGGPPEHPVLAALAARGSVLAVASRTGLPPAEVVRALSELCARGLVRPCGPGEFVRT